MNDSSKHRVQDATNTPYKAPVAFIKHPGSKDKIGRMLNRRNLWPAHTRFVDYFGGSAEMIFHRTPSAAVNEVYNDLDPDISNLFRVLKSDALRLQKRIENHGYNRKSWKWACENFRSNPDPFERAVAYFVGCNQSHTARPFGSFGDPNTTAVHTNRYGTYKSQVRQILDHAERFKDVEVRNENALDLIEEMDAPTTIHYFDPPYTFRSRGRLSTKLYRYEFGELPEHLALLCQLRGLKGMAMISGRADRLYDDVLPEWRKVTYETFNALKSLPQRNGGTAPTKRDRVVEVIWMNPRMQIELFTRDVYSGKFS